MRKRPARAYFLQGKEQLYFLGPRYLLPGHTTSGSLACPPFLGLEPYERVQTVL